MHCLAGEPGSWVLLQSGADLYLSVLCGRVGLFSIDLRLDPEEARAWESRGPAGLQELVAAVQARPTDFQPRHVPLPAEPGERPLASGPPEDGVG